MVFLCIFEFNNILIVKCVMIKTVATPLNNNHNLKIPDNYIGKKIEIIFYAVEEIDEEKKDNPKLTMGDFWGILSDTTAQNLHKEVEESRED
ncbi:MAG: hypothetical protein EAZ15_01340 [Sphingobacteriales bacterium]|nr:MAG: hypothetical protein EAZ15_01340 [Sphingobacteriales bacterium]